MSKTKEANGTQGYCYGCDSEELDYGLLTVENEFIYYPYTCGLCGFKGREYYTPTFSFHTSEDK